MPSTSSITGARTPRAFLDAVDVRDVGMSQRSEGLRLTREPRQAIVIASKALVHDLDRHMAAQRRCRGRGTPLGAAGEIGHQTILPDGPLCGCGNRGCLETLASGPAIAAEGVRLLLSGNAPTLHALCEGNASKVSPSIMGAAARAGEASVAAAIQRAAEWLGIGVANLVTVLHPDLIVLGRGVAELGDLLLTPVREAIRQRVGMFPTADVRVERSALGDNAGLMGGIALARRGGVQPG